MGKVDTFYVESLEEFVSRVRTLREQWDEEELWFRGVRSSRRPLRPSLYRPPLPTTERAARRKEDEARIEFSRRGHALVSEREPQTDFDWYILMRHNEVPTRLLDWTEGSLAALYFAVRPRDPTRPIRKENASVWVLDPQWLNDEAISKIQFLLPSDAAVKKYLPKPRARKGMGLPPVAILPPYLLRQMLTQRSVFTIQGAPNGFDKIAARRGRTRLTKIVVRHSGFDEILDDLASSGISEATLFPTLGGLGKEVTEFYLQ